MARRKKGTTLKSTRDLIINYLLRNARFHRVTQTEIAKGIGVSQSTVSEYMPGILSEQKEYRGAKYKFAKKGTGYMAYDVDFADDVKECYVEAVDDKLLLLKARTGQKAIRITRTVIALELVLNKRKEVEEYIRSEFDSKYLYDVVRYSKGLYVILNEPFIVQRQKNEFLDQAYDTLNDLYLNITKAKK